MKEMRLMRSSIVILLIFEGFDSLCEPPFFEDHERGWHWYEQFAEESEEEKKDKPKEERYPATMALKEYQAELEEAKALAVMDPTPEKILNYQKLQYDVIERSGKFAKAWMKNVYTHAEIDSTLQTPTFQLAKHIYRDERQDKIEQKIRGLSEEYGLFYFFKSECPYCKAFAPIVKSFSEKYNWEVLAISEFGETSEFFDRTVRDNGLAEIWGVNSYPSLFAVNPKTGHVIPVANGMISVQQMEERIVAIAGDDDND